MTKSKNLFNSKVFEDLSKVKGEYILMIDLCIK